ncbi:hypothetical protein N7451_011315 [Penicillium sp. IBT 35674x]|nr:hypothetical protein N7451_011315 [Penicillium sp. IBT 35674x]
MAVTRDVGFGRELVRGVIVYIPRKSNDNPAHLVSYVKDAEVGLYEPNFTSFQMMCNIISSAADLAQF